MATAIAAAATTFASWVGSVVYSTATAVGVSASTASTLSIYATAAAYASVGYAAQAVVTIGLSALARGQMPDVETQKQTKKQTRPLRNLMVGGTSRVGGAYMLRESKGSKFAGVTANCEGPLKRIDQVYLNDDRVTLSGGFVQGMAGERYGGGDLVRLETRLGLPTETHYSFLTADFGAYWPTTARGDGIASIGWLAVHRSTESFPRHFPNGEIIPTFAGTPVCYDWRDPAQDRSDPTTWDECWNPVVWLVHVEWLRHGRSWARCIQPRLTELTAEANYCDEIVDGEPRYRVAGNHPSNLTPEAVRANILATMDGWMSVTGKGEIVILAGRYVEPDFILTAEQIRGYTWKAFQPAENAVNELVVSYVSAAHDYSEVEAGLYSKDDPNPLGKSESLQLVWCPSPTQAMRLAPRKMSRLDAERNGQVRATIYGLNGLGRRYIRVQNPELASMTDVVVEVMNVEIDFARAEVIFDVILADTEIDVPGDLPDAPVVPSRPPAEPGYVDPPEVPIRRDVTYPIEAGVSQITVSPYKVTLKTGDVVDIPTTTLSGLDDETQYALFYRADEGVVAVPEVASGPYFESGSRIFLGWQTTPDGGGAYPPRDPPPPGSGGTGDIPAYIE